MPNMIELQGLTLDTAIKLVMIEAYQKVFIANGSILKVVDFINTKLSTADIKPDGKVIPKKGTIITTGTGDNIAQMIVDYVTASDGIALIYGYRTTEHTFVSGDVCKGEVEAADDVTFTLDADEVEPDPPHHYDWTVYANNTSVYGSLPKLATLICLYRGRIVLAGDLERPHQWYMTRQANPWDFAFIANDAQSPVSGNDADAGEVGDIITALIPYKDDYLVFGCANSIWVLRGDPAAGGSLDEVSLVTGIFGANSWCWDGANNLYFFGTNGIYRIPPGFGAPQNLTERKLPNLVSNLGLDPNVHRVTMVYDRRRHGLIITATKLADGTNKNFWYDLRVVDDQGVGGFFPEKYPDECGIYAMFYYEAEDPDYRKVMMGCKDGYIRIFDEAAKDDDIGETDHEIVSHVTLGPKILSAHDDRLGKLTSLTVITGGGAPGGSQADTDSLDWQVFIADSAEEIIEQIRAASPTPHSAGTIIEPGRARRFRPRVRGVYLGLRLKNDNYQETWSLEKIVDTVELAGKVR